jgi:uncharacterized protein YndB with AHSA1/START domain
MIQGTESEKTPMGHRTTVERQSDRELVVRRTFEGPMHMVYDAWTKPELFIRWWSPKSMGVPMLSCEMDVRVGGGYRIEFGTDASSAWHFSAGTSRWYRTRVWSGRTRRARTLG